MPFDPINLPQGSMTPMVVEGDWFDGPMPNPNHPIGVVIDPVRRVAEFRTVNGIEVLHVGDSINVLGRVTRVEPEPTAMEAWRD